MAVADLSEGRYRPQREHPLQCVDAYLANYGKLAREPLLLAIGDTVRQISLMPTEDTWLRARLHSIHEASRHPMSPRNEDVLRGFLQEELARDALTLIAGRTGLPIRILPSVCMEANSHGNKGADFLVLVDNGRGVGKVIVGVDIKSRRPFQEDPEDCPYQPYTNSVLGEAYPVLTLPFGGIMVEDVKGKRRSMADHIRKIAIPLFLTGRMNGMLPGIAPSSWPDLLAAVQERVSMVCDATKQVVLAMQPEEQVKEILQGFTRLDALLGMDRRVRRDPPTD